MAELKHITPEKILWLDLEMTGLDPVTDKILEVAAVVTDWEFNQLDQLESGVGQDRQTIEALLAANPFAAARPAETKELIELSANAPSQNEIESKLIDLANKHFTDGPALLAGNSIHMDRQFIRNYWPNLEAKLHYRMLDVSAWKVVMIGKYGVEFTKQETHRALDDIRESIAELRSYLRFFKES